MNVGRNSPIIPPPAEAISEKPDKFTSRAPDFGADYYVEYRVFHINTRWFRYGTDDKTHAAAIVLSGLILVVSVVAALIGTMAMFSGKEPSWISGFLSWLGNAFLFTAGVAVGRGAAADLKKIEKDD